ncbi:MAG: pitrilysin family protein [Chloroherpetonaceae bacterium]|nr:insulinase family protein [Chthonomonadaceae bacterium]MDW8206911.1 pitrilysin family protein [Chloroherpetonaceae bacterium]
MKRIALLLLSVFLHGTGALSQTVPHAPVVLPNGLRVIVRERRVNTLVGVDLWVRAGSREERPGEEGCAHLLEHLLFKGTARHAPGEIDMAIENLGATLTATTGPDFTRFTTTVTDTHLPAALALLADMITGAQLPAAELEREKGVIQDELAQRETNPFEILIDALHAQAFPGHPYRRSPGGTPEDIRARTREQLLAFYQRNYTPERCTLVLTGNIALQDAGVLAQRIFGSWSRRALPEIHAQSAPAEASHPLRAGRTTTLYRPVDRPYLGIAFPAPAASETDMACAGLVVAELLHPGYQPAHPPRDPAAMHVRFTPRKDPSLLVLMTALPVRPAPPGQKPVIPVDAVSQVDQMEADLLTRIVRLRAVPPTRNDFNAARSRVLGRLLLDIETAAGYARALGYADITGGDTPEALRARLARLTPDDIQRFARQYLDPDRRVTVRVFPARPAAQSGAVMTGAFRRTPPAVSGRSIPPEVPAQAACARQPNTPHALTLTCGARLLLQPEPHSDLVAVTVFVRTPHDRTPQEIATGDLVAHALFLGTTQRSREHIATTIARTGSTVEVLRTPDYIAVLSQIVPEQLGEMIVLLCEILKNASFHPEALQAAREQARRQHMERTADLFATAVQAVSAPLIGPNVSDDMTLRRVTPEQARHYFQTRFVPGQTVIAVTGRFQAQQVARSFESNLFDYNRTAPARPQRVVFPSVPTTQHTVTAPGHVGLALIAVSAPDVAHPDYPAFLVLHALLGDGHASRLFRRIRDALGVGYNVGTIYRPERGEPLIAYLQWDTRRPLTTPVLEERDPGAIALRLLEAQLQGLLADPPSDAELRRARNVAIGRNALRHERARDRAFLLGWYEVMGRGYAFDAELPGRLQAVTCEEVLRVARTYLERRASAVALPGTRRTR